MIHRPGKALCHSPLGIDEVIARVPFKCCIDVPARKQAVHLADGVANPGHDLVLRPFLLVAKAEIDRRCQRFVLGGIAEPIGLPDGRRGGNNALELVGLAGSP